MLRRGPAGISLTQIPEVSLVTPRDESVRDRKRVGRLPLCFAPPLVLVPGVVAPVHPLRVEESAMKQLDLERDLRKIHDDNEKETRELVSLVLIIFFNLVWVVVFFKECESR